MTSLTEISAAAPSRLVVRRLRIIGAIERSAPYLKLLGFGWLAPVVLLSAGENPKAQAKELWRQLGIPLLAFAAFVALWGGLAPRVHTSLGALPGPAQVWTQAENLYADFRAERQRERAFYERQERRNIELRAADPHAVVTIHPYTGQPTFLDQVCTSLETVFAGFLLATLVAVPLGVLCGLSPAVKAGVAARLASDRYDGRKRALREQRSDAAEIVHRLGDHRNAVRSVADAHQHCRRCILDRPRSRQRRTRAATELAGDADTAGPALVAAVHLYRPATVARCRLDGADRRGDAGPEPRPREIRLGRIPERLLPVAGEHHRCGPRHRYHRVRSRPRYADRAGNRHPFEPLSAYANPDP